MKVDLTQNLLTYLSVNGNQIPAEKLPQLLRGFVEAYVTSTDESDCAFFSDLICNEVGRNLFPQPEREFLHDAIDYDSYV